MKNFPSSEDWRGFRRVITWCGRGIPLSKATQDYFEKALSANTPFPMPETPRFVTAVVRTIAFPLIATGVATIIALTYAILQLSEMKEQTNVLNTQVNEQRRINDASLTFSMLQALYDAEQCPEQQCIPKQNSAVRREALLGYIAIFGRQNPRTLMNLDGAMLVDVWVPWGTELSHISFRGAVMRNFRAYTANLERADLSGADLSGAALSGANMQFANLAGARLTAARLDGVNMSQATGLTAASLTGACGDNRTLLPVLPELKGVKLRSCTAAER